MIRLFQRQRLMYPAGETSASNPIEVKSDNAELYTNADHNENFDDLDYESEASKKIGETFKDKFKQKIQNAKANKKASIEDDDSDDEEEKPKKAETKKKTEIDTLSDKTEGDDDATSEKKKKGTDKKESKKADADEGDEEGESEDEEQSEESEKPLPKESKGKIKLRIGDDLYGVEADSVVRYKVDGEWVERPIQEVLNRASGEEALDKKFTDLGKQKKDFETERSQVFQTRDVLKGLVGEVTTILQDQNKNPFDALQILVEKSGQDPYTLWRRSLEASLDEVEKLQGMNESERKAYFLEKKDEFRTKADDARIKVQKEAETNYQAIQQADALRQAQGVSEEQFMEAWDELEAQGTKNPSNEQIVEYASTKPHIATVQDLLEPHEDKISDSTYPKVVTEFARKLRAKEITPEQLKELIAKDYMDEDLKDLTVRKKAITKKQETRKDSEQPSGKHTYESFDDYM